MSRTSGFDTDLAVWAARLRVPITRGPIGGPVPGIVIHFESSTVDAQAGEADDILSIDDRGECIHITVNSPLTGETYPQIKAALDAKLPAMASRYHRQFEDNLLAELVGATTRRVHALSRDVDNSLYDLRDMERALFDLARKRHDDKAMLARLDKKAGPLRQSFRRVGRDIKKLVPDKYQYIRLNDQYIEARTQPVKIRFEDDIYDIGRLDIRIDLRSGGVRIENPDNHPDGYPHPHVNSAGEPCFGNIESGLYRMIGEFELYGALDLLHRYVNSYSRGDEYLKIEHWDDPEWSDGDERDEYESCYENSSPDECVQCGDADCPYQEGARGRCASNSDLDNCVCCNDVCEEGRRLMDECQSESPVGCITCDMSGCRHHRDAEYCRQENPENCVNCRVASCKYHGKGEDE